MSTPVLIAVGGNSLIRAGQQGTISEQLGNARPISRGVVALIKEGVPVLLTHGNGPQVGAALLRSERAAGQVYEQRLDVCVASTQGEIGYLLQQSLSQELAAAALPVPVVAVLTQVVVADDDPAFRLPTKPIGPFYSRAEAEDKWRRWGWQMVEDAARGFRRVVASPEPIEIVEEQAIRRMLDQEILVIAMGGGGIPVVRENGILRGADAVIDKDRASVLLARRLGLERVIFSTDADYVYVNFRKPSQQAIERATADEMKAYMAAGHFPAGNMGPKIEAALRFLQNGGREVVVTSHERMADAFHGRSGTRIVSSSSREK